jgi:hypothetical protein
MLRTAAEERDTIQALRSRLTQVTQLKQALDAQIQLLERVERLGGKIEQRPRLTAALRGKPNNLRTRVQVNPRDAIDNSLWDATFKSQAEAFGAKVEQAAFTAWQSLIDTTAPSVADDVLTQFERTGFGHTVQKVRTAREAIRVLRSRLPRDDGDLSVVKEYAAAIATELATLKTVPAAVRKFFAKAASHDATLDDLAPEVMAWMRDKDMLRLLRVGFK